MDKRTGLILILTATGLMFSRTLYADTLYLTNGRTMEGIIEKEADDKVVLNVGFGTVTLKKHDISRIERDSQEEKSRREEEWSYTYFLRPEHVPPRFKQLAYEFRNIEPLREKALTDSHARNELLAQIEAGEQELAKLTATLGGLSSRMIETDPQSDPEKYNTLIAEHNRIAALIQTQRAEKDARDVEAMTLAKAISDYTNELNFLAQKVEQASGEETPLRGQEQEFLRRMREEIEHLRQDFTTYNVPIETYGNHVVVEAVINETFHAQLLLDTGASTVTISEDIARKLGIPYQDNPVPRYATLADGRKIQVYPVRLQSVRVGTAKVYGIDATVLPQNISRSTDGLLGMSFLKHFSVRLDAKTNALILEELKP